MYAAGSGVRQDYAEAIRWFQKAAAQDYALAQNRLGVMYEKGQGVPKDSVEGYKWYFLAARQNENVFAVANCEVLSRRMTPEQIVDGQTRASASQQLTIADSD
jgi:TPR repeat protein